MRFFEWSCAVYRRPGVEPILLKLQDAHALDVNMVLWCLWTAENFEEPQSIVIRMAADQSERWNSETVAPIRNIRRKLKRASTEPDAAMEAFREQLKAAELKAEEIEHDDLEALAAREMVRRSAPDDAPGRARRILAAYVRLTTAPNSPGFTVSLLEDLIALTFARSLGDGEKHMA